MYAVWHGLSSGVDRIDTADGVLILINVESADCHLKQGSTGPQGSLGNPRKPYFYIFSYFLRYVLDFLSNINVFHKNIVISELLQQK